MGSGLRDSEFVDQVVHGEVTTSQKYDPKVLYAVRSGERVRLSFVNKTTMWHQMRLRGDRLGDLCGGGYLSRGGESGDAGGQVDRPPEVVAADAHRSARVDSAMRQGMSGGRGLTPGVVRKRRPPLLSQSVAELCGQLG